MTNKIEVPFTKAGISEMLQEGKHVVSFYKVNGDIRDMMCSLNPNDLPAVTETVLEESDKPKRVKKPSDEVLSVWDINSNGWRSFRIENVFNVSKA